MPTSLRTPFHRSSTRSIAAFLLLLLALPLAAQSLNLTDERLSFPSLTGTTVTLNGHSELHLTNAGDPIPGCLINLTTPDSWVFFHGVKPSQTVATLLDRLRVNGALAVQDGNVRVTQFAEGSVVLPHAPTFQPMEAFTGQNFTGQSKALSQYIPYNSASLGALNAAIRSFTLKRGYMATIAQTENGGGTSKVYVAQDSDLEVGVLPDALDGEVRFVRIFPWRWVGKKGIAGNIEQNLDVKWLYNWNLDRTSPLDWEYVPIRQTEWWPGLNEDWKDRGATHLLGFNEPDRPDQANMSVAAAIARWPELQQTGLRLGAPAVSDGGIWWIEDFMDQANAAGLRVDYVPVHYYRSYWNPADPAGAANQFYNFLLDLHNRVQRPLWITEWNNGANWTADPDPSFAQQAATIAAITEMLDNTSFVERYSIFNWVEDVRRVVWDDGSPTSAGIVYRDNASPNAYGQETPDSSKGPAADYLFEGDFRDSSGNGNSVLRYGTPKLAPGRDGTALSLDGTDDYLKLSPRLGDSADFSFTGWVRWNGGGNWQRIFDLGDGQDRNLFLTPKSGDNTLRFAIKNGGAEQQLNATALTPGVWNHLAVTIGGNTGKLFVNGALVNTNNSMTINPADVGTRLNYLGKSQWPDPLYSGLIEEARFHDRALSDAEVAALHTGSSLQFDSETLTGPAARVGLPFTASLAEFTTTGTGTRTFSKVSGPSWLVVSGDGSLTGVPGMGDLGTNAVLLDATDDSGTLATATYELDVHAGPGLVLRFPFDNNAAAAVGTGTTVASGGPTYTAGVRAQAVNLDGINDFLTLPAGAASAEEITIATWIHWDGGGNWQRLFDFGNGTDEHLFLTPKSGGNQMLFLIRADGVDSSVATATLPTGQWVHLAATIGGGLMKIFVNGVQAASGPCAHTPSDFNPATNFIGDSQFAADPFLDGRLDEFVLFHRALSQLEIGSLMNAGPPAFPLDPLTRPAAAIGIPYEQSIAATATDPDPETTLEYSKTAGPAWLTISSDGRISGVPGPADAGINSFRVRATNPDGLADEATLKITVPGPAGLLAHFQFDGDSGDNQGGVQAIAFGGPTYQPGLLDQSIALDGTDDYVHLRNNIVSGLNDVTVATRVLWNGGDIWQRLFDFGNNTTDYMLVTPRSGANTLRFTISIGGNAPGAEQRLEAPQLPIGEWAHVAVTLAGDTGTLYLNGVPVDSGPITLDPSAFNPTINYLGRSQYPDPYFNGRIDDVRIYNHALTPAEVHDLAVPPPPVVLPAPGYPTWADGIPFAPDEDLPGLDPDHDRIANVFEWLYGTSPLAPSPEALPVGTVQSAAALGLDGDKTYLTFSARLRKDRPGVTLLPEAAANLTELGTPESATHAIQAGPPIPDGDFETFTWFYDVSIEDSPDGTGFMRLKVQH